MMVMVTNDDKVGGLHKDFMAMALAWCSNCALERDAARGWMDHGSDGAG